MARQLIRLDFDARALQGGYAAWQAAQPVEPKTRRPPLTESLPAV